MNTIEALKQIEQMSDCGSPELTIVRMKSIATDALRQSQQPTVSGNLSQADKEYFDKAEFEQPTVIQDTACRIDGKTIKEALEQPTLTDEQIEQMAEKEYPLYELIKGGNAKVSIMGNDWKREGYIKGAKAILNLKIK